MADRKSLCKRRHWIGETLYTLSTAMGLIGLLDYERELLATELYRQTKDIRLVQKALGHADLSTTMIYTHIVDDDLEAALKGLHFG
jgi:integrase